MAIRQDDTPTYREIDIALGANGQYRLNRTCENVAIINMTGEVELSINDAEFSVVRGGIIYKMPNDRKITSMVFRERLGATATITVATGDGTIQDNRASFAGNLPVVNAASPNNSLQVDLIAADPGLVALATAINNQIAAQVAAQTAALEAALSTQSDTIDWVDLTSATYYRLYNQATIQTVVSSGANTSGIIVLSAWVCGDLGDAVWAGINDGSDKLFVGRDGSGTDTTKVLDRVEKYFIPPGVALRAVAANTEGLLQMWYRVL